MNALNAYKVQSPLKLNKLIQKLIEKKIFFACSKHWYVGIQKVFKHTADVVEDYFCYILVALGAIALSVRFLTSMGTGEAICMITGTEWHN